MTSKPALHRISERILRFNKPTSPSSKNSTKLGVVVHAFNASTQEAEAGGVLSSRPAWCVERFQDNQDYSEKPCFRGQGKTVP